MVEVLDIRPHDLAIVREILQKTLPSEATVWVFGSRATAKAKKTSDFDLAIDLGRPLEMKTLSKLMNEFEVSALPYRVDIVDWQTASDKFKTIIAQERKNLLLND